MRRSTILMFLAVAFVGAMLTGCELFEKDDQTDAFLLEEQAIYGEEMDVSQWAIFENPTPELLTVSYRQDDVDRLIYHDFNMDKRQFWDDWISTFYWDRTSRLNRRPIP